MKQKETNNDKEIVTVDVDEYTDISRRLNFDEKCEVDEEQVDEEQVEKEQVEVEKKQVEEEQEAKEQVEKEQVEKKQVEEEQEAEEQVDDEQIETNLLRTKLQVLINERNQSGSMKHFVERSMARLLIEEGRDSLKGLGIPKLLKENLSEIMDEIALRKKKLAKDKTKYVAYGIGSGSPHPNKRTYLSCTKDLETMRSYCKSYNYFLGSTCENGSAPSASLTLIKIRYCCIAAFEVGAHPLLYFTGHSDSEGDWWFYDDMITFNMVLHEIEEARREIGNSAIDILAFIVSDCCFSGIWCEKASTCLSQKVRVISSAGVRNYAKDDTFAPLFFKLDDEYSPKAVKSMRREEVQCAIKHLSPVGSSMVRENVDELKEILLEMANKRKLLLQKCAMKCKPMFSHGRRELNTKDLDDHWFHHQDESPLDMLI